MGIGLNVNELEISEEISSIATSLRIEKGITIQREFLLSAILNNLEFIYNNNHKWTKDWNS